MSPNAGYRYSMNGLRLCNSAKALALTVLMTVLWLAVSPAFAADPPPPDPVTGLTPGAKVISTKFQCDQSVPGITNRAVKCVEKLLKDLAKTSLLEMVQKLSKAAAFTMMIYVCLTGMKSVLGGMRNPKGEILIMFGKLAMVGFFAVSTKGYYTDGQMQQIMAEEGLSEEEFYQQKNGVSTLYNMVKEISQDLTDMVSENMGAEGGCAEGSIWNRVDCTILAFVGKIKINKDADGKITNIGVEETKGKVDLDCDGNITGDEADQPVPDVQMFEMAVSQFFTPHGIFILALVVIASLILLGSFTYALFTYIISLVALTFLMMLAPIFFPLFLFQRTKQMFMIWLMQIISYTIQPCIIVAFLSFLLATVNVTIHGDGTSGGLKQTLAEISTHMEKNQCTRKAMIQSGNAIMANLNDEVLEDKDLDKREQGKQMDAVTVPYTPLPYDLLATFMVQLIAAIVLLYIMYGLLKNVSDFAGQLTGGGPGGNLSRFMPGLGRAGGTASAMLQKALRK